jgi:dihydrofolate reductase
MRPRCSVFIAASLDGFIARRDGGIDWLSIVETPGEDYGYAQFFGAVDALIFGRRTYDTVLAFPEWPYGDKRCVVLTHDPPASRHGERFHTGAPAPLLEQLHADGVRRVYVDGGAVIQSFLRDGLIDDITLSIIPVLLGDGIPLFGGGGPGRRLRLQATQKFASGLVQVAYQVTNDPI